jgi:DNA-binding CsgD family transcriptional regulator
MPALPSHDLQERLPERLARLCHRALDLESFQREAHRVLQPALGDDGACWLTVDPATLLPTTHTLGPISPEAKQRELTYEYTQPDVNQIPDLLRGRIAAGLDEATDGQPGKSPTYRDVLEPEEIGDELRGVLVIGTSCWGGVAFFRRRGRPSFDPLHAEVLRTASPLLAEGVRRALVLGGRAATGHTEPGLVLLDAHDGIETMNGPARTFLTQLRFVGSDPPELVHSLAHRTRLATTDANRGLARLRAPTATGAWLTLHGSVLEGPDGDDPGRVAIVIEPARGADLLQLAFEAYGLTARERDVATLVARRLSTPQIGRQLFLSPWTVKDHLKAIFEKVGVSSQAQLVAAIHLRWAANVGPQGHHGGSRPAAVASRQGTS